MGFEFLTCRIKARLRIQKRECICFFTKTARSTAGLLFALDFFPPQNYSPFHIYVNYPCSFLFLKKIFIHLFIFGERGKEGEGNINVWLPLVCPLLGTWPTTQACALTGNGTSDPSVHRPALNPLSHTSQGFFSCEIKWAGNSYTTPTPLIY